MKLTKKQIQTIIDDQITVDCYEEHEVNIGWAIFMEENIHYPFEAEYKVKKKGKSAIWQKIQVINNETNESNYHGGDFYVEIEINEMIVIANLNNLRNIKADEETMKTLQVWQFRNHY